MRLCFMSKGNVLLILTFKIIHAYNIEKKGDNYEDVYDI